MWIRSQDKTVLANAQGIYIDSRFSVWSDGLLLGEYSTKDKALKVLDEIQRKVEYPGSTLFSPTSLKNCYCLTPTGRFHQMPQDDEVEV